MAVRQQASCATGSCCWPPQAGIEAPPARPGQAGPRCGGRSDRGPGPILVGEPKRLSIRPVRCHHQAKCSQQRRLTGPAMPLTNSMLRVRTATAAVHRLNVQIPADEPTSAPGLAADRGLPLQKRACSSVVIVRAAVANWRCPKTTGSTQSSKSRIGRNRPAGPGLKQLPPRRIRRRHRIRARGQPPVQYRHRQRRRTHGHRIGHPHRHRDPGLHQLLRQTRPRCRSASPTDRRSTPPRAPGAPPANPPPRRRHRLDGPSWRVSKNTNPCDHASPLPHTSASASASASVKTQACGGHHPTASRSPNTPCKSKWTT